MAVTDTVIVELQAKLDQYNRNVANASSAFDKNMKRMENSAVRAEARIQRSAGIISTAFKGAFGGVLSGFAAGFSVRAIQQMTDNAIKVRNALRLAGHEGEELNEVYNNLFESAQRNMVPINSMVDLYSKLALSQRELNVSSEQMREFVDAVGLSLRVSGTDAVAASGALTQLGQAMGGGVVRAEEFSSMLEGAPGLLRAAAAGIEEAGGSVAKLRQLMLDGKLSSQALFHGMVVGADEMRSSLAGAEVTISGAFVRLQNVLQDVVGKLDDGTGGSAKLAEALDELASAVGQVDFDGMAGSLGDFIQTVKTGIEWILQLTEDLHELGKTIGSWTGLDNIGKNITRDIEDAVSQDRIENAFETAKGKGDRPTPNDGDEVVLDEIVVTTRRSPIKLSDYPVAGGSKGGGGGRKRGGGGGRGGSRESPYEREVEQLEERIALLTAETEMMRTLNPLIDDYGYSLEKARTVQELLNAAKKAGLEVTPALRENIEKLAEQYATASAEAQRLAEEQDRLRQSAEDFRNLGKDVMSGFINDLRQGKSATEALANALQKVADKLLDMALNSLFSGGGGGGFLGGIFSLFGFAKGGVAAYGKPQPMKTFARGGVSNTAAIFGEAGPEAAVPLPDGRRIPVDLRTPDRGGVSQETVKIVLQDDSGRMADIADQRINLKSGPMLELSVARSTNVSRKGLPSASGYYQKRGVV